jgi:hypothetical protein
LPRLRPIAVERVAAQVQVDGQGAQEAGVGPFAVATGSSIDSVVRTVDMINREDKSGQRRVRIHAVGFPVRPDAPQFTNVRFATLMRILCHRNGGTFVGIDKSS